MPDPIARKRLKKKMLERWENEGGSIAADTASADVSRPSNAGKGHGGKRISSSDSSTADAPASPKKRKPTQK
jgi:hypothetical protein